MISWLAPRTACLALAGLALAACNADGKPDKQPGPGAPAPAQPDPWVEARERMVRRELLEQEIPVRDARVIKAMREIRRDQFVPEAVRRLAYASHPLPIGHQQTISAPYIVGFMSEALALKGEEKVLEIGTGSGYQAAVLARLAKTVYTIEIVEPLAKEAKDKLKQLGFANVTVRAGDGYKGWPEHAPFDAIMVTAAPDHVPQPLKDQLKVGGRLVLPVGPVRDRQTLLRITRTGPGPRDFKEEQLLGVMFVPMTGPEIDKRKN